VVITALAGLVLVALYIARDAILIAYISVVLAIGLGPIVHRVERFVPKGGRALPRWFAILIIYLGVVCLVLMSGLLVVPPLVDQAQDLWTRAPQLLDQGQEFLIRHRLLNHHITLEEAFQNAPGPGDTMGTVASALTFAFGGIIAALAPERIVRDGLALAIVATVFWGSLYRLDATLAMAATLLSSIAVLGLVRIAVRRLRPPALGHVKPVYAAEDWWRPTLPLTVITIADNLMSRSAVIALGLTGNTRDAGIFAAAFSVATVTALPRMAVAISFAPTVSALFALGDRTGLQSVTTKAAWLSLIGTACAAIPLLLLAHPLLAWFGRDFVAGAPIVTILVLGQVFAAACGPQQHLITMTGNERAGATILAACASSSFAGCVLMIGSFGMTGAAFATTLTLVGWNVAMAIFIHRSLHLMPGVLAPFKAMPRRKRAADYGI